MFCTQPVVFCLLFVVCFLLFVSCLVQEPWAFLDPSYSMPLSVDDANEKYFDGKRGGAEKREEGEDGEEKRGKRGNRGNRDR